MPGLLYAHILIWLIEYEVWFVISFWLDPVGSPLLSSDPLDNVFCCKYSCTESKNHMVSWLITDGQFAGDSMIAWDDLKYLDDHDYDDLVVRVSGVTVVPVVPAAAWMFGSGLLVLAAFLRRRV